MQRAFGNLGALDWFVGGETMASSPSNKIDRTHQMYREGRYEEVLGFYKEALALAKTKLQKTALHSNRAACYLKLHNFKKGKSLVPIPELEAEFEEEYKEEAVSIRYEEKEEIYEEKEGGSNVASKVTVQSVDLNSSTIADADVISPKPSTKKAVSEQGKDLKVNSVKNTPLAEVVAPQAQPVNILLEKDSKGWQAIPKPKGHSTLDYGRWNRVEDDDGDNDEEDQPQYRFRVKTVRV